MGGGRRNVRVAATIGTVPKAAVQNMGCVADGGRNGHVYRNPNDIRTPNSVVRIAVQAGNIDHLVCFVGSSNGFVSCRYRLNWDEYDEKNFHHPNLLFCICPLPAAARGIKAADQAVSQVIQSIERHKLTTLKTECLMFIVYSRENQNRPQGGRARKTRCTMWRRPGNRSAFVQL